MDKIFLSALRVDCIVGIWEWERRVKQTVIIDLEMAADVRRAAATDHIDDTLDYKRVAKRLLSFVADSRYQLVETLTERIARLLITEFGIAWVKVRLNKQGAIRGARDVGIEIERRCSDYQGDHQVDADHHADNPAERRLDGPDEGPGQGGGAVEGSAAGPPNEPDDGRREARPPRE